MTCPLSIAQTSPELHQTASTASIAHGSIGIVNRNINHEEITMRKLIKLFFFSYAVFAVSGCNDSDSNIMSYTYQDCIDAIDVKQQSSEWLCQAIEDVNQLDDISEQQKSSTTSALINAAKEPTLACDSDTTDGILTSLQFQTHSDAETKAIENAEQRVCSRVSIHEGYWVSKTSQPSNPNIIIDVINDLHIDAASGHVVVYAQQRIGDLILAPIQLATEECTTVQNGSLACAHPDAVYLNETGEELALADGSGAWWVKHEWNLFDDETLFTMCNLGVSETYNCGLVQGHLLDDELTMQVGTSTDYNLRTVYEEQSPVQYSVTVKQSTFPEIELIWDCFEDPSAFDGKVRYCPVAN